MGWLLSRFDALETDNLTSIKDDFELSKCRNEKVEFCEKIEDFFDHEKSTEEVQRSKHWMIEF